MRETPFDPVPPDQTEGAHQAAPDPSPSGEGGRSLAAGRAFLAALGADLAVLRHRAARWFRALAARRSRPSMPRLRVGASQRVAVGLLRGIFVLAVAGLVFFTGLMIWALHDLPPERPVGDNNAPSLILEASNGASLGRVGALKMPDAARKDFPDVLVKAVISIEDRHYYSHWGFDPQGMLRALRRNAAAGTIVQGGSTITQQVVKLRILGHERTLTHKLREALVAMWLDMHRSKDDILTEYLNSVYLGNGVYGMSAAARLYFDKSLADLTLPQAAMLAGMIQSPSRTNPLQNLEGAQARAAMVVDAMRETGAIDAKQAVGAVLNAEGARRHASQAALVAMRPDGAVVAMVGGRDYQKSQFNRAVNAQRQPGSAFKLFVYFAALRNGLTLDDTVDARPLDIKGWEPENYGGRHFGRVPLAEAFADSINTAAVRLAQQVGLNQVIAAARDLGITSPLPNVPSLPLGTADMNLLELTAAYAAVAAGKTPVKPWGISGLGVEGQSRLHSMGAPIVDMRPLQPYQQPLVELLEDVVRHGTGRAAALDGFSAGKTGTAQDYRDAWFIGFNDELVVGVWVGNDDHSPMDRVTGGSLPAEIWKRFMTSATNVVAREEPAGETPELAAPQGQGRSDQNPAASAQPSEGDTCNYQACARTYQSFRAYDCTYQPYGSSERRVCGKMSTSRPRTAEFPFSPDSLFAPRPQERGAARCNVAACADIYESFDPATCTYQPYDGGPRRVCTK
jgi:membrane peptidoglycan carboxypeptidase